MPPHSAGETGDENPGRLSPGQGPSGALASEEECHQFIPRNTPRCRAALYRDALRQQRKSWGGTPLAEFWFYYCNTHELLACFAQHPKHPITRPQRVTMLLVMSAISLAFSCVPPVVCLL